MRTARANDRRRMTRALAIAALLVALAGLTPTGSARAVPPGARYYATYIRSGDGTRLSTEVFRPAALPSGATTPVILIVSPYFGDEAYQTSGYMTPHYYDSLFDAALPRGYTIVQVTLRGFGGSGGCSDFGGPGSQADVKAAVEWAASQPWSTGRVGMYGLSTDAIAEIMALAERPRGLAATVIMSGSESAYRSLYMNGVRYAPMGEYVEPYYELYGVPPPSAFSGLEGEGAILNHLVSDPSCLAARELAERNSDPHAAFWRARDLVPRAMGSTVPTFWSQGFLDANVKPDTFLGVWSKLRGPRHAWIGQYPHLIPGEGYYLTGQPDPVGRSGFLAEVMRWFDRHVKRRRSGRRDPPVEIQEGSAGSWRIEQAWPPPDARDRALPVLPGSYRDEPGNKGQPYCTLPEPECPPGPTGNGSWTFSAPLPYPIWLAGAARLRIHLRVATPSVTLVALLYDVNARGQAALISRGATSVHAGLGTATLPGLGSVDTAVSFDLYPQDWRLESGHRLAVLISGADDGWFTPGTSGTSAAVVSGAVEAPFLRYRRTQYLRGGPSQQITQRTTVTVDDATIRGRTARGTLPPPLAPKRPTCTAEPTLRITVKPRRAYVDRLVHFRFLVEARTCHRRARPVPGATIRFDRRRFRTNADGRATVDLRLEHTGRYRAVVRRGALRAATSVQGVRPAAPKSR